MSECLFLIVMHCIRNPFNLSIQRNKYYIRKKNIRILGKKIFLFRVINLFRLIFLFNVIFLFRVINIRKKKYWNDMHDIS